MLLSAEEGRERRLGFGWGRASFVSLVRCAGEEGRGLTDLNGGVVGDGRVTVMAMGEGGRRWYQKESSNG